MSQMWCTTCLLEGAAELCACGARTMCAAGPDEQPMVIAHVALLDSTVSPPEILAAVCDGPRRLAGAGPFKISSWRHGRSTVWMWRAPWERIPPHSGIAEDNTLSRLLASSNVILIDAPQASVLFAAQYARNRTALAMPSLPELLERVQTALELCGSRSRLAVLIDPSGMASKETIDRLALIASPSIAPSCEGGVRKLLPALTKSSLGRRWAAPRLPSPSTGWTPSSEKASSKPPSFRILAADVGGSVASHLLLRLHQHTSAAVREWGKPGNVKVGGNRFTIKAVPSPEALQAAESYEFAHTDPPPGFWQPQWDGMGITWFKRRPFSVELFEDENIEKPCAMIVGVGPYRIIGERELCSLLDRVWQGQCVPAALVAHRQCDQRLLEWASREFPAVRLWPDTWEGNVAAVEQALMLADG